MPQRAGRVRDYNREYMRQWRAIPTNRARALAGARESYRQGLRKPMRGRAHLSELLFSIHRHAIRPGFCEICGNRPARECVERNEIDGAGTFVPVMLAWCGGC